MPSECEAISWFLPSFLYRFKLNSERVHDAANTSSNWKFIHLFTIVRSLRERRTLDKTRAWAHVSREYRCVCVCMACADEVSPCQTMHSFSQEIYICRHGLTANKAIEWQQLRLYNVLESWTWMWPWWSVRVSGSIFWKQMGCTGAPKILYSKLTMSNKSRTMRTW